MNSTYPYNTGSPFTPGFNPGYFPGYTPGAFNQYPSYNAFPGANNNTPWNNQWNNWNNAYTPFASYPFNWTNPTNTYNAQWNNTPWNNAYPTYPGYAPNANWNSTPWGNWGFYPIAQNNAWSSFNPWFYAAQNVAPGAFNTIGNPPTSAYPFPGAYTGNTGSPSAPWYANAFNQNNAGIPGAYPFNAAFYGTNTPNRVNGTTGIPGINGVQQPVREAA